MTMWDFLERHIEGLVSLFVLVAGFATLVYMLKAGDRF